MVHRFRRFGSCWRAWYRAAPAIRGAAYGLRQALDTVGAFLGLLHCGADAPD
ncbi:MFS transporter [Klebsiella pneumoniae]|nr:MFS transporter [Klebsiella pneumoniae]